MNSTHEDAVLGFDLDFLHPTTVNIPIPVLRNRYVAPVKKRIVRVDALNNHCNALKQDFINKNKELECMKIKLQSIMLEHTQTSVEYKEVLENYTKCEKECINLKDAINNFREKYLEAENRVLAGRSHIEQLQQLVKQQERKIDALGRNEKKKNEKLLCEKLEKELLMQKKKYKKDMADWQIKYVALHKKLLETKGLLGKFNKELAQQNNNDNVNDDNDLAFDDHSENEDESTRDFISQFGRQNSAHNNLDVGRKCSTSNKHNLHMEIDNDSKIESVSIDTGCGSSLASSDNEKWLNSPDFVFSPIHGDSVESNPKSKMCDTASSPPPMRKMIETATSPLASVKFIETATSPIRPAKTLPNTVPSVTMVEVATSPITIQPEAYTNSEHSSELVMTTNKSVELTESNINACTVTKKSTHCDINEQGTQAKDYLELNNSNNIEEECGINREIEMIFNTMRLNATLITPIPETPRKLNYETARTYSNNAHSEGLTQCACPDAAAARAEAATAIKEVTTLRKSQKLVIETVVEVLKRVNNFETFMKGTDLAQHGNYNSFENDINPNSNDNVHVLLNSAATLENSLVEMDSVRSPTPAAFTPDPLNNNNSEQTLQPHYENEVSFSSIVEKEPEMSAKQNDIFMVTEKHTKDTKKKRVKRVRKLTNLAKYRKKCEVQNRKIKRETPPLKKRSLKPKKVPCHGIVKLTTNDTSATLNDKQVYAKAVKVMAELNAKASKNTTETVLNAQQELTTAKDYDTDINNHPNILSATSPKLSVVITPIPVEILSPRLKITSPISKKASPITDLHQIRESTAETPTISSRHSVKSSKSCVTSPELAVTCPELIITCPELDVASPTRTLRARKTSVMSPTSAITSSTPIIKSPTCFITSPIPSITSPRCSDRPSAHSVISAKPAIISPDLCIKSSAPTITSPKLVKTRSIDSTKNFSNHESGISEKCTVVVLKDLSIDIPIVEETINTSIVEKTVRKRKLFNGSNLESKRALLSKSTQDLNDETEKICSLSNDSDKQSNRVPFSNSIQDLDNETEKMRKVSHCSDIQSRRLLRSNSLQDQNKEISPALTEKICSLSNDSDKQSNRVPFSNSIQDLDNETEKMRKVSHCSNIQCRRLLRSNSLQDQNKEISPALTELQQDSSSWHPNESILCYMIQKHAKTIVRRGAKKASDPIVNNISEKIEKSISKIIELKANKQEINAMNELVDELKKYNYKKLISGLIVYLKNPKRRIELFKKETSPPAPQMTKSEAILLFVIKHLTTYWHSVDFVGKILSCVEFHLFQLSATPDFDIVESMSHFYALVARYFGLRSRLKIFMLDGMYCMLYKAIPLVKQCLEVWPHILPLAHMSAAKIPIVSIFVYLLQFYNCKDNSKRVDEIRKIIHSRYSYQFHDWNERRVLELVNNSILELSDIPCEKKMLRLSIILLAKRHGTDWTQRNIIKKLFQLIEKEQLSEHKRAFCIAMIGPLMRPYPIEMKLHCEIAVNQLMNMLNTTTSRRIEEATIISMITMSKHNMHRANEMLLSRKMSTTMSPEFEKVLITYVRMKPRKLWSRYLSNLKGLDVV